jgi:Protein of unknown function (DUF3421)
MTQTPEVLMRGKVIGLVFGLLYIAELQAQTAARAAASSLWVAASGGEIPAGAAAHGQEADGREQFVCRGTHGGGMHIGKITRGFSGCNIGYGGREITLADYEVLVQTRVRRADMAAEALASVLGGERGQRTAPAAQPATSSPAEPERGFDDDGTPVVTVHLPDGTIEQRTPSGGTRIKPDGTREPIHGRKFVNAPMPTPPELPEDPKQGRAWMERQNEQLLSVIRALVKSSEPEMKKFTDAERKAAADDIFEQIAYRAQVAAFLAQER